MTDSLYLTLHALRLRNYEKCAECCKKIPNDKQKEKWYLICKARSEESWTDFTEPDEMTAADAVFDEHVLSELPRPGTSLRTGVSRGNRPVTNNGMPVSGYAHTKATPSRAGAPVTSMQRQMSRLATASLVFSGDEPDVTSIHVSQLAKDPCLSRILEDYLIHRMRDPIRAASLAAECTTQHGFNDWWWKSRLGRAYYMLGMYSEAEAQLKSALNTSPNVEARLELAKLYVRIDQPTRALAELELGQEQFPLEGRFLLGQARLNDMMGNTARAKEMWRNVLEIDQANIEAVASLAASTFYDDQPETAEVFYMYLRKLGVANTTVLNNLAVTALGAGDYDKVGPAIVAALTLAATPEERADVWYNISHVAISAGDLSLAQQTLLISTSLSAKSAEAFNNLGLLELKHRNIRKSLAAFKAATEANPEMHEPWFNMALVYERIGQLQEAHHAAQQAVRAYPQLGEAVTLLEQIEQQLK